MNLKRALPVIAAALFATANAQASTLVVVDRDTDQQAVRALSDELGRIESNMPRERTDAFRLRQSLLVIRAQLATLQASIDQAQAVPVGPVAMDDRQFADVMSRVQAAPSRNRAQLLAQLTDGSSITSGQGIVLLDQVAWADRIPVAAMLYTRSTETAAWVRFTETLSRRQLQDFRMAVVRANEQRGRAGGYGSRDGDRDGDGHGRHESTWTYHQ